MTRAAPQVAIRALGFQVRKADVAQLVREYDVEGSGKIEKEVFVEISACARPGGRRGRGLTRGAAAVTRFYANRDPEEEIREAFKLFDRDGTGRISLRNVRRIARELGESLTEEEMQVRAGVYRAHARTHASAACTRASTARGLTRAVAGHDRRV